MFGKLAFRGLACGLHRLRARVPLLIIIWRWWRALMRDVPRWVFEVDDDDEDLPEIDLYDWFKDLEFEE